MPTNATKVIKHLSQDPLLKKLINTIPAPKLVTTATNVSEALIESIVYQQLSIKAAAVIYNRLLSKFDNRKLDLAKLTRMRTETLRSVGLSYSKADYVRNIARFFLSNENKNIDWHVMDDEELIKRLTVIKGVGIWTVQMIMISPMGREDVFPVLDLGIQQGVKKLYNLQEEGKDLIKKMQVITEHWKPYRTYACLYLWRWKDQK